MSWPQPAARDEDFPAEGRAMMTPALKVGRGIRWYLRQMTGEAKWDGYLERCARADIPPMSRRDFERHRSQHRESTTQARCC